MAGDPDDLVISNDEEQQGILKNWKETPSLKLLNLVYDLTPCEMIAMVVTEIGMVFPASSLLDLLGATNICSCHYSRIQDGCVDFALVQCMLQPIDAPFVCTTQREFFSQKNQVLNKGQTVGHKTRTRFMSFR